MGAPNDSDTAPNGRTNGAGLSGTIQTAFATGKKYLASAQAAAKPYVDQLAAVAQPHLDTAKNVVTGAASTSNGGAAGPTDVPTSAAPLESGPSVKLPGGRTLRRQAPSRRRSQSSDLRYSSHSERCCDA